MALKITLPQAQQDTPEVKETPLSLVFEHEGAPAHTLLRETAVKHGKVIAHSVESIAATIARNAATPHLQHTAQGTTSYREDIKDALLKGDLTRDNPDASAEDKKFFEAILDFADTSTKLAARHEQLIREHADARTIIELEIKALSNVNAFEYTLNNHNISVDVSQSHTPPAQTKDGGASVDKGTLTAARTL